MSEIHDALASLSDEERKAVLVRHYALFAAYYYDLAMEDFMDDMVQFTDDNPWSVILLPAGHTKSTTFGRIDNVRHICWNRNIRIQLVMSVYDDAEEYCKAMENDLTSNELLLRDFGPFYNPKEWKNDGFTIIGRQHNDPKPTMRIFGAGGKAPNWTLKGQGCDRLVLDDAVTEDTANSPESRKRQANWFRMGPERNPRPMWGIHPRYGLQVPPGIDWPRDAPYNPKPGRKSPYGQIVVPGTRFNPYDLYNDLIMDDRYAVMHLPVWAEKVDGQWQADVTETKPLWTFMWTNESLKQSRAADLRAFECRMQNNPMDASQITFHREWFDGDETHKGCLDDRRSYGQWPTDEKGERLDLYTVLGFDPASGKASIWAAFPTFILLGFPRGGDPEQDTRYVIDAYRNKVGPEWQLDIMFDGNPEIPHPGFHAKYDYDKCKVEDNGFADLLLGHHRVTEAKRRGVMIEPCTTGRNKQDPVMGVKSMTQIFRDGLVSFPNRDAEDEETTRTIVDQFCYFSFDRNGKKKSLTDYVMAFWFCETDIRKIGRSEVRAYKHPSSSRFGVVKNPYYANQKSRYTARKVG